MLKIFAIMIASMALGWVLRRQNVPRRLLARGVSVVILLLMYIIGVEVGGSSEVLHSFGKIFINAGVIAASTLIGCCTTAYLVNRYILKVRIKKQRSEVSAEQKKGGGSIFSFLIVGVFGIGVLCSAVGLTPLWVADYSLWALYLLVILVGFNIGSDVATLEALRGQSWRIIFLPVATVVGSLAGVMAFSWMVEIDLLDRLAVGSGMAYYSLSSALLGELRGAELGAVALVANVFRELATVVFAGFIARRISPLALISCGGATTIDVTMPVIIRECGGGFVAMAVFHGVVVDLSVPVLVTLFGAW